MVSKGRSAAYKQTHARILLLGDEAQEGGAMKDEDIARPPGWPCDGGAGTPPLCGGGFGTGFGAQGATGRRKRLEGGSPLDCPGLRGTAQGAGQLDAAIAGQWTGGKGDSESISSETVRQTLKKTNLSLGERVLRKAAPSRAIAEAISPANLVSPQAAGRASSGPALMGLDASAEGSTMDDRPG